MKHPCHASPDCLHAVCQDCDKLIRAYGHAAEDHPGTILGSVTTRYCQSHHKARKPVPYTPKTPLERIRHENNVAGLERFMARIKGKSRSRV